MPDDPTPDAPAPAETAPAAPTVDWSPIARYYAQHRAVEDGRPSMSSLYAASLGPEEVVRRLSALWAPTDPALISKLPRGGSKTAENVSCDVCHGWHKPNAIHLDYLGHSDTCLIIARADPFWEWRPKGGFDDGGVPLFIRGGNGYPFQMWIDLEILGFVRPGIGTVEQGKGDPEKELIGDAIRNAAMRFGIGADLWSKAGHQGVYDLDAKDEGRPPEEGQGSRRERPPRARRGEGAPSGSDGDPGPGGARAGAPSGHPTDAADVATADARAKANGWESEAEAIMCRNLLGQLAAAAGEERSALVRSWREASGGNSVTVPGWTAQIVAFHWLGGEASPTGEELAAHMASAVIPPLPDPESRRAAAVDLAAWYRGEQPPAGDAPADEFEVGDAAAPIDGPQDSPQAGDDPAHHRTDGAESDTAAPSGPLAADLAAIVGRAPGQGPDGEPVPPVLPARASEPTAGDTAPPRGRGRGR